MKNNDIKSSALFELVDKAKDMILNDEKELEGDLKEVLFAEIIEKTVEAAKKLFLEKEDPEEEYDCNDKNDPFKIKPKTIITIEEKLKYLNILAINVITQLGLEEEKTDQIHELVTLLNLLPTYFTFLKAVQNI
jgi:hypothetical protein